MSNLAFVISAVSLAIFSFSVYALNLDVSKEKMRGIMPAELSEYGLLKFLTYQCLLIQTLSAFLHVAARFSGAFVGARDLVFACLAYPVGSLVVYTFWAVWHVMGREFIFPQKLSEFYPDWLNHATHTIIAPINLLLLFLVPHRYPKRGLYYAVLYLACYGAYLHYIKFRTGIYVYPYMEKFTFLQRLAYFVSSGVVISLLYLSGKYLSRLVHGRSPAKHSAPQHKKPKQK